MTRGCIPDEPKYIIEAGTIFALTEPQRRYNKNTNAFLKHNAFIWVLRKGAQPKGIRGSQNIRLQVFRLLVPQLVGLEHHHLSWQSKINLRTLTKALKPGYKVVAENCNWYYRDRNAKKFYKHIEQYLNIRLI